MYEYHDDLRAEHAASSPWWAWPFDLKPVWFYQGRFAGGATGLIQDTGNLVVLWMGVPAMAFTAFTCGNFDTFGRDDGTSKWLSGRNPTKALVKD